MAEANKVIRDVELHWCSVDKNNPVDSFSKKVWSVAAHVNKETAKKLKKANYIKALKEVEDAEGNETGLYKINLNKMAVSRKGEPLRPPGVFVLNDKGQMEPLDTSVVSIGNGSKGHVSFSTYDWSYEGRTGTSMSLQNIVVTDLVPYVRTSGADEFGLEEAEGSEFKVESIKEETAEEDVF
jgi:hypothetical protein